MSAGSAGELNWLLDNLVNQVAQVHQAVVLSSDGLLVGASTGLTRENAEHLSAVAASFQSLARSAGRQFGGGAVRQTIVEMDHAFLFVTAAGSGACLAVLMRLRRGRGHDRVRDGDARQAGGPAHVHAPRSAVES